MRVTPSALVLALVPLLLGNAGDPGVVLRVDRATFSLRAIDLARSEIGPRFRVVLGSPSHPTPRGRFVVSRVVRNPAWNPGPAARERGAQPLGPSSDGPLGVAKLPFGPGAIALHGGAHDLALGKPVGLGCVETRDRDLEALLDWLEARRVLAPPRVAPDGQVYQTFRRPVRVVVE